MNNKDHLIRVALIDDDTTLRESYAYLIGTVEDMEVAGAYASFEHAARDLVRTTPDVVLLDIGLPGITGIDAIPRIRKLVPDAQIIMLTVHETEDMIFTGLSRGATGYLTKDVDSARLVLAIREVMDGGAPMTAGVARLVIRSFQKSETSPLTKRETEVLEMISAGNSRKQIADTLFVDQETVKTHVKNIYSKLDVHSRADAIRTARENRFI